MLYNGEISRMHLAEGTEIPDSIYRERIVPMLTKRAKERLIYILKSSDKPENELRRKLKEGFYPVESIEEAVNWAKGKHYIDDSRYIETYIRYHSEGKSRKKLMYDLQAKGLDRELIMSMIDESEIDEDAQIEAELRKRHYSPDMDPKEKQKILAALTRKGYSWSAVSSHVSEF